MSAPAGRLRLSEAVRLHVSFRDTTRFGAQLSDRFDRELRVRLRRALAQIERDGLRDAIARAPESLAAAWASPDVRELFCAPDRLRDDVLYPEPDRCAPSALVVEQLDGERREVPIPDEIAGQLATILGALQRGEDAPRTGAGRAFTLALERAGALTEAPPPPPAALGDATLVGHACVRLAHGRSAIVVDPFLLPSRREACSGLAPLTLHELGPIDAVLITHSHPDHFDLGTLLRVGPDKTIIVPHVARESILATDMEQRLRALGFRRVQAMRWWESARIGDIEANALPFYGEQPTAGEVLHPEVRNAGNTYRVKLGPRSVALTVDSGRDALGCPADLAREAQARLGAPDLLFGGHRGFGLYPLQYLLSSVARYLLFVPPQQWSVRQRTMSDSHELLDTAEAWGAREVVPYAAGGAPWFWQIGLGPALDGSRPLYGAVDPEPEAVVRAAAQRSGSPSYGLIASPVQVRILRPGDGVDFQPDGTRRARHGTWPFAPAADDLETLREIPEFCRRYAGEDWSTRRNDDVTSAGDSVAWLKKKALLGLLARDHARRLGVYPSASDVRATSHNFRRRFGLCRVIDTQRYFEEQSLDAATWMEIMTDICAIDKLEAFLQPAVMARVPAVFRVWNARARNVAR